MRFVRPLLLLIGLAAVALVLRTVPGWSGTAFARLGGQGTGGVVVFTLASALLVGVGAPRQFVAFAGGLLYGSWRGGLVALIAQALGCLLGFYWARVVARNWAQRRFGARLTRVDRFLAARPFVSTLTLRLLPVGNNLLLTVLAGLSQVAAPPFFAASILGYLPQTAVFALLGGGVRVARATQLTIGIMLFALSAGLGFVLLRTQPRTISEDSAHLSGTNPTC